MTADCTPARPSTTWEKPRWNASWRSKVSVHREASSVCLSGYLSLSESGFPKPFHFYLFIIMSLALLLTSVSAEHFKYLLPFKGSLLLYLKKTNKWSILTLGNQLHWGTIVYQRAEHIGGGHVSIWIRLHQLFVNELLRLCVRAIFSKALSNV